MITVIAGGRIRDIAFDQRVPDEIGEFPCFAG